MAFKIGALSFGGGFVIVPLMRGDAVTSHHWLTAGAFGAVVAFGQLTPGPLVATIAGVGYGAAGLSGAIMAAAVAFAPSILFVSSGARHLVALRQRRDVRAFLDGAGPAAVGAIAGSAILLVRACTLTWQWPIATVAFLVVVVARRSPPVALLCAVVIGVVARWWFGVSL